MRRSIILFLLGLLLAVGVGYYFVPGELLSLLRRRAAGPLVGGDKESPRGCY